MFRRLPALADAVLSVQVNRREAGRELAIFGVIDDARRLLHW